MQEDLPPPSNRLTLIDSRNGAPQPHHVTDDFCDRPGSVPSRSLGDARLVLDQKIGIIGLHAS
jgi:hypothetical protein